MRSRMNIWNDMTSGKLDPYMGLATLLEIAGGRDTRTFRRIERWIATKQTPKVPDANSNKR